MIFLYLVFVVRSEALWFCRSSKFLTDDSLAPDEEQKDIIIELLRSFINIIHSFNHLGG